jgi:DNA-binding GntR family transcriptional regulator
MQVNNLKKYLLNDLRLRIVSGELTSGQKINEVHLSILFGISRGPLREALRILENEGLVAYKARKGTYSTNTSMGD